MKFTCNIKDLEAAIQTARSRDPAYEPGRGESSVTTVDLDVTPTMIATGPVAEVVIVNTQNKAWVERLIYTMERAGLRVSEDYLTNSPLARILVFTEK